MQVVKHIGILLFARRELQDTDYCNKNKASCVARAANLKAFTKPHAIPPWRYFSVNRFVARGHREPQLLGGKGFSNPSNGGVNGTLKAYMLTNEVATSVNQAVFPGGSAKRSGAATESGEARDTEDREDE